MTPDLTGQTLVKVDLDYTMTLTTDEGWEVTIEGDKPVDDNQLATALRAAIGKPITQFAIDDGVLSLVVGDARIRAIPDPTYESWNIAGPEKQLVVCLPGGELAVWS